MSEWRRRPNEGKSRICSTKHCMCCSTRIDTAPEYVVSICRFNGVKGNSVAFYYHCVSCGLRLQGEEEARERWRGECRAATFADVVPAAPARGGGDAA